MSSTFLAKGIGLDNSAMTQYAGAVHVGAIHYILIQCGHK
jgi:hypothetical protein